MNVLVLSPMSEEALVILRRKHSLRLAFHNDTLSETTSNRWHEAAADVVLLRSGVQLSRERLVSMPRLQAVIRTGSGTDNIDVDFLKARNIKLFTIQGLNAEAVAELTFGLFIDLARRITHLDGLFRGGTWAKHAYLGTELKSKTLGIVGLGKIGTRVAQLGLAWGMNVVGTVRTFTNSRAEAFSLQGIELSNSLVSVAQRSDFLSIHLPLTDETRCMINAQVLGCMKNTAILVNVGRADVVEEGALLDALELGIIAAAGMDVHYQEACGSKFEKFPNVVLTPHIGSETKEAQQAIGEKVIQIIEGMRLASE